MWDLQTIKRINSGKVKLPRGLNCALHLPKKEAFANRLPKEESPRREVRREVNPPDPSLFLRIAEQQ